MPDQDDYKRGHEAGGIEERLASHDRHFAAINGSLADVAKGLQDLTLGVQRLGDQAEANARTVITTAQALKEAEEARRGKSDQSWSPVAKFIAILGAIATIVGLYLAFR